MFSLYQGKPILSLSGNPFAAAATFELLGRPLLAALSGEPQPAALGRRRAVLDTPFPKASPVRRFVRGRYQDGRVTLPEGHSSGQLASLVGCNCLVDIPAGSGPLAAGQAVDVLLSVMLLRRSPPWKRNLNHFDAAGNAVMVDVTAKAPTQRTGGGRGDHPGLPPGAGRHCIGRTAAKGDVLGVARVAGIMAAKRTCELIPLCHPLMLTHAVGGFRAFWRRTAPSVPGAPSSSRARPGWRWRPSPG